MQDKLSVREYEDPFRGSDGSIAMWLERSYGKDAQQTSHSMKEKASALRRSQVGRA